MINDQGGRKKLKDYMIDEKIPQKQRDQLWLLADGSHIPVDHRMANQRKR